MPLLAPAIELAGSLGVPSWVPAATGLALGGVFGAGLGESRLAGGLFLPNAFNDFIFAIIGEELGLLGVAALITLYGVVIWRGVRASLSATEPFGFSS